jgi:hypothetical protein
MDQQRRLLHRQLSATGAAATGITTSLDIEINFVSYILFCSEVEIFNHGAYGFV